MKSVLTIELLTTLLDEHVDLSASQLHREIVFGDDLPIDSRDMLRVLSKIEGQLRIRFTPPELLRLRTIGDLLDLVAAKV